MIRPFSIYHVPLAFPFDLTILDVASAILTEELRKYNRGITPKLGLTVIHHHGSVNEII